MRDMEAKMADGRFVMVSDLTDAELRMAIDNMPRIFEEDGHGTTLIDVRNRLDIEQTRRRLGL